MKNLNIIAFIGCTALALIAVNKWWGGEILNRSIANFFVFVVASIGAVSFIQLLTRGGAESGIVNMGVSGSFALLVSFLIIVFTLGTYFQEVSGWSNFAILSAISCLFVGYLCLFVWVCANIGLTSIYEIGVSLLPLSVVLSVSIVGPALGLVVSN